MKTRTGIWLTLLIGLTIGYGAGVTTMMQIRGREARKQTADSPELVSAKARLAQLRMTFTDQSALVRDQLETVRRLETREHKL